MLRKSKPKKSIAYLYKPHGIDEQGEEEDERNGKYHMACRSYFTIVVCKAGDDREYGGRRHHRKRDVHEKLQILSDKFVVNAVIMIDLHYAAVVTRKKRDVVIELDEAERAHKRVQARFYDFQNYAQYLFHNDRPVEFPFFDKIIIPYIAYEVNR